MSEVAKDGIDPEDFHFESRANTVVKVIAITAPLILIGCLCTLTSPLYSINENVQVFVDSQEQETKYCQHILYVQLQNGVCRRGVTMGFDIAEFCIQWSDIAKWNEIDNLNAEYVRNSSMIQNGTKPFMITDLAAEAEGLFPNLNYAAIGAITCACTNLVFVVISLDSDLMHNQFQIEDIDWFLLSTSTLSTSVVLAFGLYGTFNTYYSDMVNPDAWTNLNCDNSSTPTIGYYILCIGGLFAFISWLFSVASIIYLYIIVDTFGFFVPKTDMEKAEEEEAERQKERDRHRKEREKEINDIEMAKNKNESAKRTPVNHSKSPGAAVFSAPKVVSTPGSGLVSSRKQILPNTDIIGSDSQEKREASPAKPKDIVLPSETKNLQNKPEKPEKPPKPTTTSTPKAEKLKGKYSDGDEVVVDDTPPRKPAKSPKTTGPAPSDIEKKNEKKSSKKKLK